MTSDSLVSFLCGKLQIYLEVRYCHRRRAFFLLSYFRQHSIFGIKRIKLAAYMITAVILVAQGAHRRKNFNRYIFQDFHNSGIALEGRRCERGRGCRRICIDCILGFSLPICGFLSSTQTYELTIFLPEAGRDPGPGRFYCQKL